MELKNILFILILLINIPLAYSENTKIVGSSFIQSGGNLNFEQNFTNMLVDVPLGNCVYGLLGNGTWKWRACSGGASGGMNYTNLGMTNISNNWTSNQNITGDIILNNNSIKGIFQLIALDGSAIRFSAPLPFVGFDQSITIMTNQTLEAGVITHALIDKNGEKVLELWQSGKNESGGYHGNSYIIAPNNLSLNASLLTNCIWVMGELGMTPRISCDTATTGADLLVQDDIELGGKLYAEDGVRVNTTADFFMDDAMNIVGNIHLRQTRREQIGTIEGINYTLMEEDFEGGSLGNFQLLTTSGSPNEWTATNDFNCFNGICARASRIVGGLGTPTIMQSNFSTTNFKFTNVTFRLNTTNLDGGISFDYFNVTVNDNVDSGEIEIYSIVDGTNVNGLISVNFPIDMDDQTLMSLRYICKVNLNNEECFVDDVIIKGTSTTTDLLNVTRFDTLIEGGSGDGTVFILYNDSSKKWEFSPSNISFTSITEQDINITNSITLDDETLTNWDNLTNFNNQSIPLTNTYGDVWINQTLPLYNLFKDFWYNYSLTDLYNYNESLEMATQPTIISGLWDFTAMQENFIDFINLKAVGIIELNDTTIKGGGVLLIESDVDIAIASDIGFVGDGVISIGSDTAKAKVVYTEGVNSTGSGYADLNEVLIRGNLNVYGNLINNSGNTTHGKGSSLLVLLNENAFCSFEFPLACNGFMSAPGRYSWTSLVGDEVTNISITGSFATAGDIRMGGSYYSADGSGGLTGALPPTYTGNFEQGIIVSATPPDDKGLDTGDNAGTPICYDKDYNFCICGSCA